MMTKAVVLHLLITKAPGPTEAELAKAIFKKIVVTSSKSTKIVDYSWDKGRCSDA